MTRTPTCQREPFISDGERYCTYADLHAHYATVGNVLARRGVDPDACVAVYGDNMLQAAVTILYLLDRGVGCALCGQGHAVPRFCRYVVHCESTPDSSGDMLSAATLESCLRVDDNPNWRSTTISYRGRFYARTSGTTGSAKIAMFTQEKLWANARNCTDRFALSDRDRVVIPVPVSHMYGFGAGFLPAVLAGASIEIQADSNIPRYLQREAEFEPTVAYLTPTFCYMLTRLPQAARRYRLTVAAGDKIAPDTFERYERLHGCLISLYGSTELGAVAAGAPDDGFGQRCHTVGRLLPGVEVTNGIAAAPGLSELWFMHPTGGEGYADDRGETDRKDERFANGRLRSKDVGSLGADGYLRIIGRSDHMVKRNGVLVAFNDVERALLKNGHIEGAVVLSDGVTPRGARLTAVCELRTPSTDARAIREESKKHLPAYAVPDRVLLVDQIPRLQSGKEDRKALLKHVIESLKEGTDG